MIDSQAGRTYTKTGAYNLLKELLEIPKSSTINKHFFKLFFDEVDGFFRIKKPLDLIKNLFTEEGIREMNKMYYFQKQEKSPEAEITANRIMLIIQNTLAA